MDKSPALGQLELEVLRHFAENGPLTVGEAASGFGEPRGYARTTIQTVMERLRGKGMLEREAKPGGFTYRTSSQSKSFLSNLVREFVAKSLGGDTSLLAAYLAESEKLTPQEAEILRKLAKQGGDE